jgi:hypothetical protein
MKTFVKVVCVAFVVMFLVLVGSGLLLAAAVVKSGLVTVEVHSSGPDGDVDLVIPVPAVIVPLAALGARFGPRFASHADCDLDGAARHVRDWTPVAAAALRELADAPDAVLVDVRDRGDSVQIVKRGDTLEIEVIDRYDGRVEVRLPVDLLPRLADALD